MNNWSLIKVYPSKVEQLFKQASRHQLEEGLRWYEEANRIALGMARLASKPLSAMAGVIASLSPSTSWERNLEEAYALSLGQPINHTTYPNNVLKAKRILAGEEPLSVLGGRKVRAFYSLILNPSSEEVCIDRHALRACTRRRWQSDQEHVRFLKSQYDRCAMAYRVVARKHSIRPHQAQAVVWTVQRGLK